MKTEPKYRFDVQLTKKQKNAYQSVLMFCGRHNATHARRNKTVSCDYQHRRFLRLSYIVVIELHALQFHVESLEHLKPRHVIALLRYWEAKGLSGGAIQNKLSVLRWACRVLNKRDCIPDNPTQYLIDPSRYRVATVARTDKSSSAKGVDPMQVMWRIAEKDVIVGVLQLLKATFGLRNQEAIMLRPHEADKGDHLLVRRGTKGGRTRTVSLLDYKGDYNAAADRVEIWDVADNRLCREILDIAKLVTDKNGSLIPAAYSLKRWKRWERYVTETVGGLTKADVGITPHAFRHEYLSQRAESVSEITRALKRKAELQHSQIGRDRVARQVAAMEAGHNDSYTNDAYYGGRQEQAPAGITEKIRDCLTGPLSTPVIRRDRHGRVVGGSGRRVTVYPPGERPKSEISE